MPVGMQPLTSEQLRRKPKGMPIPPPQGGAAATPQAPPDPAMKAPQSQDGGFGSRMKANLQKANVTPSADPNENMGKAIGAVGGAALGAGGSMVMDAIKKKLKARAEMRAASK